MTKEAQQLLDEVLRLPMSERALVAAELMASMDGAPDADAEQAWGVEIARRARRALTGESEGLDWDAAMGLLKEKHRGK
jgi:hypothetical protein